CAGFPRELCAGPRRAPFSRPPLVPGRSRRAGARLPLVWPLRALVAAAQLGALHRRSAHRRGGRPARTALELPPPRRPGEVRTLRSPRRRHAATRLARRRSKTSPPTLPSGRVKIRSTNFGAGGERTRHSLEAHPPVG